VFHSLISSLCASNFLTSRAPAENTSTDAGAFANRSPGGWIQYIAAREQRFELAAAARNLGSGGKPV